MLKVPGFMPRFQKEVFDENLKLVKEVEEMAAQKSVTPAQIALGWIVAQSGKPGFPTIMPIPGATTKSRIAENLSPAELSDADMAKLAEILKRNPIQGGRYNDQGSKHIEV
jgi:pyridoxine 4-dehydrogenase